MWKLYYHPDDLVKAWIVTPSGTEVLVEVVLDPYYTIEDRSAEPFKAIMDSNDPTQVKRYPKMEDTNKELIEKVQKLNWRDYGQTT